MVASDVVVSEVTAPEFADLSLAIACPMANEGEDGLLFVNGFLPSAIPSIKCVSLRF